MTSDHTIQMRRNQTPSNYKSLEFSFFVSTSHQYFARVNPRVLAHLSKSNSRTFPGSYKGYVRRTKLNQTGTFISIHKCHKLPQRKWILCTSEVRKKPSGTPFQYQLVRSRRFKKSNSSTFKDFRHRFKAFQGPCLFSRTFQALKIWTKIKDFQGPTRAL